VPQDPELLRAGFESQAQLQLELDYLRGYLVQLATYQEQQPDPSAPPGATLGPSNSPWSQDQGKCQRWLPSA
jgi:hypothetical protein